MLVVIPPQVYFERRYHLRPYDSFWDFYRTVFTTGSYPQGNLSWHHLWYIPYIWAYSMVLLPLLVWLGRAGAGHSWIGSALRLHNPWLLFLPFSPPASRTHCSGRIGPTTPTTSWGLGQLHT